MDPFPAKTGQVPEAKQRLQVDRQIAAKTLGKSVLLLRARVSHEVFAKFLQSVIPARCDVSYLYFEKSLGASQMDNFRNVSQNSRL
jgi:hypothetical protein